MTHTPGPWRVWEAGKESWEVCEPSNPNRHSHFANVRVGNMWGDEGKANARLIAAAPELLDALEGLMEAAEFADLNNSPVGYYSDKIKAALDAISKARRA